MLHYTVPSTKKNNCSRFKPQKPLLGSKLTHQRLLLRCLVTNIYRISCSFPDNPLMNFMRKLTFHRALNIVFRYKHSAGAKGQSSYAKGRRRSRRVSTGSWRWGETSVVSAFVCGRDHGWFCPHVNLACQASHFAPHERVPEPTESQWRARGEGSVNDNNCIIIVERQFNNRCV